MAEGKRTFEESMGRLERIVSLLERGDAPLEAAMELFEEGAGLLKQCQKQLDEAEQKVTMLTVENGRPVEIPFQEEV